MDLVQTVKVVMPNVDLVLILALTVLLVPILIDLLLLDVNVKMGIMIKVLLLVTNAL